MEILYLYIEDDHLTIKDEEFNFSNHISFSFKKSSESSGVLNLDENAKYIENFFGEPLITMFGDQVKQANGNIVNITAIIGENGVGKTNLLNFIIDSLTSSLPIGQRYIVAFKDQKKKSVHVFHTFKDYDLKINGNIEDFKIYGAVEQTITVNDYNYHKDPPYFVNNFELIFYSPTFDLRNFPPNISNEFKSYIDVSTNALIENDVLRKGDSYPEYVKELELHKYSNIRRQFEMLLNLSIANLNDVNLPSELSIIFHREHFNPKEGQRNLNSDNGDIFDHFDKLISTSWQDVNSKISNSRKLRSDKDSIYGDAVITKLKIEFTHCLINNYFHNLSQNYHEDIHLKLEDIVGENLFDRAKFFFTSQNWQSGNGENVQAANLYSSILNLIEAIDFNRHPLDENANSFITDITGGIVTISNYERYITSIPLEHRKNFLSTSWRNISSGENALIDLYARLYFANKKMEEKSKNSGKKEFLYIIIDEGEIGFHPQWQSQYLYNLTTFIKYLFIHQKVQIILTSHSPFLVSDLPKNNLIFLEKIDGLCKVINFEEETFAANIHSLLSHQFFMKDGVIGKFSRTKIKDELKPLLDEKEKNLDVNRLKKIIALIGEPVLRSKLNEILNTKIETNV